MIEYIKFWLARDLITFIAGIVMIGGLLIAAFISVSREGRKRKHDSR